MNNSVCCDSFTKRKNLEISAYTSKACGYSVVFKCANADLKRQPVYACLKLFFFPHYFQKKMGAMSYGNAPFVLCS